MGSKKLLGTKIRRRNVLAPNEIFGTSNCFSGYEGIANGVDGYSSCHLRIYEPNFGVKHTRAIISLSTLAVISMCLLMKKRASFRIWIKVIRRKRIQRNRHVINAQMNMRNAFEYATKDASKEK